MVLTGIFVLGVLASSLEARVVDIDLVRIGGVDATWYNKVEVELASGSSQSLRLCPSSAAVTTWRKAGEQSKPVSRYPAHALRLPGAPQTAACRNLSLQPGKAQRITFVIREVPGRWRGEDAYLFDLEAGDRLFRFVQAGQRTPG